MAKNLPEALSESLKENSVDTLSDVLEVGIDAFLDEGITRDIPILSTVMGIYRTGENINNLYLLKKLKVFVCAINDGIASKEDILKYKNKLQDSPKKRQQELEYILVLINRYINLEKPEMLAKLYLSYLDGIITWLELTKYSEVIDRFLPDDFNTLIAYDTFKTERDINTDAIQRLIALGLFVEDFRATLIKNEEGTVTIDPPELLEKRERNYTRTEFGNKFAGLFNRN